MRNISTVRDLRKAITECKTVFAQVRFGVSETWVKIPKASAREIAVGLQDGDTPGHWEIGTDRFAELDGDNLYLG